LRQVLGGGAAGMDALSWIYAKLLLTSLSPERPPVPPVDGLRPWTRFKTVAEVADIHKYSATHDERLEGGFLLEYKLIQLID
jgi:hypothetical protein